MRLHLICLPHTRVEPAFCGCAYTNKCRLFIKMMKERHDIIVYAPESDRIEGVEMVNCLSDDDRIMTFGHDEPNKLPNWPTDEQSRTFNLFAAAELSKRLQPRDIVLLVGGLTNKPIHAAMPNLMYCEPFVGYEGIFTDKVAFESYAWMHSIYRRNEIHDIRYFDTVIHPFVDRDEFPVVNDGKGDYLLFVGRLIKRKGPHIALEIAKAAGIPLKIAGAGGKMVGSKLVGLDIELDGGNFEYMGPVNVQERAELMSGARAVLTPTTFLEPGCNVAIEAMMAGTPVIANDWGILSESVRNGHTGFHFRLFREAVAAVKKVELLNSEHIRDETERRFGLAATAEKFDHWFNNISALFDKGWYEP